MYLANELKIEKGVTAIIGSGGKTTLLHKLAAELSQQGSVILTTSTHIRPSEVYPCLYSPTAEDISAFFAEKIMCHPEKRSDEGSAPANRVILNEVKDPVPMNGSRSFADTQDDTPKFPVLCIGTLTDEGKFTACDVPFEELEQLADYVLVEADGSRMLPLKAHRAGEPVIPANTRRTVCVVGAAGLNKPIREAVHRPELFCSAVGATPAERATPVFVAWLLNYEDLAEIYYVNQCDLPESREPARELASLLCKPAICGSLQTKEVYR